MLDQHNKLIYLPTLKSCHFTQKPSKLLTMSGHKFYKMFITGFCDNSSILCDVSNFLNYKGQNGQTRD